VIVRLFRAVARPGQEGAYVGYLRQRTEPFLRSEPGCLEVRVASGLSDEARRGLLVLTVWDSVEHLRAATGPAWDEPVLEPEEAAFVESATVEHFEEP
jgi:hypothetical protein